MDADIAAAAGAAVKKIGLSAVGQPDIVNTLENQQKQIFNQR